MDGTSNAMSASYSDNSGRSLALLIACLVLSMLFVILRFIGRKVERVSWWWDDWTIVLSVLIFIAGFWANLQIVQFQSTDPGPFLHLIFIHNVFYPLIISTTKISGLLLHLVHFGLERSWARNSYILIALVASWGLATFFATLFQCQPFDAAWGASTFAQGHCIDQPTLLRTTSILDAALTLLILISTFPGAYSIDWIFGRGTLITLNYVLGTFMLICAILRVVSVPSSSAAFSPIPQQPQPTSTSTPNSDLDLDFINAWTPLLLWTKLEEALGIVTVCLYPSVFALLALFTCNFQEPKSRVFAHFRLKTRAKIAGEGFGALLGDSEERRAWAGGVNGWVGEAHGRVSGSFEVDGLGGISEEGRGDRDAEAAKERKLAELAPKGTEGEAGVKLARLRAQLDEEAGWRVESKGTHSAIDITVESAS